MIYKVYEPVLIKDIYEDNFILDEQYRNCFDFIVSNTSEDSNIVPAVEVNYVDYIVGENINKEDVVFFWLKYDSKRTTLIDLDIYFSLKDKTNNIDGIYLGNIYKKTIKNCGSLSLPGGDITIQNSFGFLEFDTQPNLTYKGKLSYPSVYFGDNKYIAYDKFFTKIHIVLETDVFGYNKDTDSYDLTTLDLRFDKSDNSMYDIIPIKLKDNNEVIYDINVIFDDYNKEIIFDSYANYSDLIYSITPYIWVPGIDINDALQANIVNV